VSVCVCVCVYIYIVLPTTIPLSEAEPQKRTTNLITNEMRPAFRFPLAWAQAFGRQHPCLRYASIYIYASSY